MKPRIIGILIIISIACSCSKFEDLREKEVYGILNEIIKDDSLMISNLDVNYLDQPLNSAYLEEFSSKDRKFIMDQYERNRKQKVDTSKLKLFKPKGQVRIINGNDTIVYKEPPAKISYPYISLDRKRVLIILIEDSVKCGGAYLYVKEKGHWKRKKTLDYWIS